MARERDRAPGDARPDLVAGSLGHDPARGEHDDPFGDVVGLFEVVGGEQHRAPGVGELPHRTPEAAARLDVHPHGGLVEDEQVGVGQQREGVPQALGLAAGEPVGPRLEESAEVGPLDNLSHRERLGVQTGHQLEDVDHPGVGEQRAGLEHRPDPPRTDGGERVEAEDRDGAGVGLRQAEDHLVGGRLAGAVRAEDGDDLTGLDAHGEVVDRPYGTVGLGQVRDLDGGDMVASNRMPRGWAGRAGEERVLACHQPCAGRVAVPRPRVTT